MGFLIAVQLLYFGISSTVAYVLDRKNNDESVQIGGVAKALLWGWGWGVILPLVLSLFTALFAFSSPSEFKPYAKMIFFLYAFLVDLVPAYFVWYRGVVVPRREAREAWLSEEEEAKKAEEEAAKLAAQRKVAERQKDKAEGSTEEPSEGAGQREGSAEEGAGQREGSAEEGVGQREGSAEEGVGQREGSAEEDTPKSA